jgi:hypothetical protein
MRSEESRAMVAAAFALAFLAGSAPASLPPPASGAVGPSRLRVQVRLDMRAAGQLVHIAALMDTVRSIWRPYADITFADVAEANLQGFDETVHLIVSDRAPAASPGRPPLGWITFIAPGEPGDFVTVSVAAVRSVMTREKWLGMQVDQLPPGLRQEFVTRMVSWSAAHELGHYLLRSGAHSSTGLMREQLSAEEVMRNDRTAQRLEARQVELLRDRAARESQLVSLHEDNSSDEP